jgi:xanthine phosphoribosyltransferase
MRRYTPKEFIEDCEKLADMVKEYNPEVILPIARGGLSFAHLLSEILNVRDIYCINSIGYEKDKKLDSIKVFNTPTLIEKRVLVVDDIVDSGETLKEVLKVLKKKNPTCEFKTATIFYKKNSTVQPDFTLHEATQWIEYFWNK